MHLIFTTLISSSFFFCRMRSGRCCRQGLGKHRAIQLTQLGGLFPPSSVLSGQPFVWIMTQPLARHSKHLLADLLINSRSTLTPTIHCLVYSQIEWTGVPTCQAHSRPLWWWPKMWFAAAIKAVLHTHLLMLKNNCAAGDPQFEVSDGEECM